MAGRRLPSRARLTHVGLPGGRPACRGSCANGAVAEPNVVFSMAQRRDQVGSTYSDVSNEASCFVLYAHVYPIDSAASSFGVPGTFQEKRTKKDHLQDSK